MTSVIRRYTDPTSPGHDGAYAGAAVLEQPGKATGIADEETPVRSGYGACAKCNCKGFEGNAGTCANRGCGHAYEDHW